MNGQQQTGNHVVKVEPTNMEEFEEDMEENLDINVDQGQAINYGESPSEFDPASETKKQKPRRLETNLNLPCDVCGKRFPNKRRLEVHQIIHTDKKPFQCDQCDRAFNQPANMMTHKKKMHYKHMDKSVTEELEEEPETRTTEEKSKENDASDNFEMLEGEEEVVDLEDKIENSEKSGVESK